MPRYAALTDYSPLDADAVHQFTDALEGEGLSISELAPSAEEEAWAQAAMRQLVQANALVVFLSRNRPMGSGSKLETIARNIRKQVFYVALDGTVQTDAADLLSTAKDWPSTVKRLAQTLRKATSAPVMSVYNVKGGVGKTTLVMNLGMYFYKQARKRVLLLDFDPQTNLSTALVLPRIEKQRGGILGRRNVRIDTLKPLQDEQKTVLGLLDCARQLAGEPGKDFDLPNHIHTIERGEGKSTLDIVAGDPNLHVVAMASTPSDNALLQVGMARFIGQCRRQYDLILFDLGPSINSLSHCALAISTHVLSPVTPNMFAMQGLQLLDGVSAGQGVGAQGREHLILINYAGRDGAQLIRLQIESSHFRPSLLSSELRASESFSLKPQRMVDPSLGFLPAYEKWGPKLSPARQSLQQVATEISRRVGVS